MTAVGTDRLGRLSLLATAISGRVVLVAPAEPGEPAWTDGMVIFLGADARPRDQLEALAVQASLLAAGSLAPDVVRRLARHPGLARRYLALEGHRALAANEELLPPPLQGLINRVVAASVDSPAAALAAALGRDAIADPPASFGAIRARQVLASAGRQGASRPAGEHVPRKGQSRLPAELDANESDEDAFADLFTSPVGGGGALGRLLRRMLGPARRPGNGPPGADAPTHQTHARSRGSHSASASVSAIPGPRETFGLVAAGTRYPEWDVHRRRYRPDWCTVLEVQPQPQEPPAPAGRPAGHALRRPLARLGLGLDRCHRQDGGDDIDIDAAIEARVETLAGSAPDEAVYVDNLRRRRDLAVLILLDISGSAAEPAVTGGTVHQHQQAAAEALTVVLHDLGDRVALYAFCSHGRSAVRLLPVKHFDDNLDSLVFRRLHGLAPGGFSRLGAAIRHGASVLEKRGGTPRRLLVVLSDGLAYDHGYERRYGEADARRALAEARRRGTGCVCLSIGARTDGTTLAEVFGTAAHATVPLPEQLSQIVGPLFRAALRAAEVRRAASARSGGRRRPPAERSTA